MRLAADGLQQVRGAVQLRLCCLRVAVPPERHAKALPDLGFVLEAAQLLCDLQALRQVRNHLRRVAQGVVEAVQRGSLQPVGMQRIRLM